MAIVSEYVDGHEVCFEGLNLWETELLLPYARKIVEKYRKKYEYYEDIHEGGEATSRQDDKMIEYGDDLRSAEFLVKDMELYLKRFSKK